MTDQSLAIDEKIVPFSPYYIAFAFFRLAVIFEGIVSRAAAGNQVLGDAGDMAQFSTIFARYGLTLAGA